MVYNITEGLLLRLGKDGIILNKGKIFRPTFVWERIDAWKRCCGFGMRFLLLPWCLAEARWLGRRMKLSAGAVILLTEYVATKDVSEVQLKVSFRWPSKLIRRYVVELLLKGFLTCGKTDGEDTCTLTVCGMNRMLFAVPEYDYGRLIAVMDSKYAYREMVDEVLLLNNRDTLNADSDQNGRPPYPAMALIDDAYPIMN